MRASAHRRRQRDRAHAVTAIATRCSGANSCIVCDRVDDKLRNAMDMTERDPSLEPFDALIGTWDTEATHPTVDAVVPGTTTFEWLEGRRFVVQRSHNDHALFPDAISVIGAPESGEGLVMEYFDSRGVRRTFGVSLADGLLRMWRDDPAFAQRFSATLAPDGFKGLWQLARTPGDWSDDVQVRYRRRA